TPRPVVEAFVRRLIPGAHDSWSAAGIDEFLRAYLTPRGRVAFYAAARQIYLENGDGPNGFWTRLSDCAPRSLFLWGRRNQLVPIGFARHVADALPSAEHVELDCGNVLQSHSLETRVVADLRRLFPSATETTINRFLRHIRDDAAGFGVIALVTSVWFGSSFWGALDTAFCRIYHVECRKWLEQKRFAVLMLVVVLLLMCATVVVPTAQSILIRGAKQLPFGLAHRSALFFVITALVALAIVFLTL